MFYLEYALLNPLRVAIYMSAILHWEIRGSVIGKAPP